MPASYKIPQNVDLEDKILGPLTLKQFLYALGAGMVSFVTFSTLYETPLRFLFFLILVPTWLLTVALIFVRPNDQPFSRFLLAFLSFRSRPTRRTWRRMPALDQITLEKAPAPKVAKDEGPSAEEVRSKLQQLAHVVDTRGWSSGEDVAGRVTSTQTAVAQLNVKLAAEDEPEDILAREDEDHGSDRATRELERLLHQGVSKPKLAPKPVPKVKPVETQASQEVQQAVVAQVRQAAAQGTREPEITPVAGGELDLSAGEHEVIPS